MSTPEQFAKDIAKFCRKLEVAPSVVVKRIISTIAENVVDRSPVDTGKFKANWHYTHGSVSTDTTEDVDPSGEETKARMLAAIAEAPAGGKHNITNALPYAAVIEYGLYPNPPKNPTGKTVGGYSTQAPAGVVRITVLELQTHVHNAVEGMGEELALATSVGGRNEGPV